MSKTNIENLRRIAPGFPDDKDDDWMFYLSQQEQVRLKKWRREFLSMIDDIDEAELDGRRDEGIVLKEKLNTFIRGTLLVTIPKLKEKAINMRNEKISNDLAPSNKRFRLDDALTDNVFLNAADESEYLPSDFLPRSEPTPKKTDSNGHERISSELSHSRSRRTDPKESRPQRSKSPDKYYDNVPESNKDIFTKLRPQIELYKCKDRVLDAIESHNRHMLMSKTMEGLKNLVNRR